MVNIHSKKSVENAIERLEQMKQTNLKKLRFLIKSSMLEDTYIEQDKVLQHLVNINYTQTMYKEILKYSFKEV